METLVVLCYIALILFSICCLIYINKAIMQSFKEWIDKVLKDTDDE